MLLHGSRSSAGAHAAAPPPAPLPRASNPAPGSRPAQGPRCPPTLLLEAGDELQLLLLVRAVHGDRWGREEKGGPAGEARDAAGEGGGKARRRRLRLPYPEVGLVPAPPPPGAERTGEIIPAHLVGGRSRSTCGRAGAGGGGRGRDAPRPRAGGGAGRAAAPATARDRGCGSAFSAEAGAAGCAGGRACRPAGQPGGSPWLALAHLLRLPALPGPQEVDSGQSRPLDLARPWEPHSKHCARAGLREPPLSSGTGRASSRFPPGGLGCGAAGAGAGVSVLHLEKQSRTETVWSIKLTHSEPGGRGSQLTVPRARAGFLPPPWGWEVVRTWSLPHVGRRSSRITWS